MNDSATAAAANRDIDADADAGASADPDDHVDVDADVSADIGDLSLSPKPSVTVDTNAQSINAVQTTNGDNQTMSTGSPSTTPISNNRFASPISATSNRQLAKRSESPDQAWFG